MIRLVMTLALALATGFPAYGEDDIQALVTAGELSVDSTVSDVQQRVPGQRTELVLEVATSNWFSGGTRIRIPEVPGLVILQTEPFAANASETRQGKTWVIQRWTLDLYPQRDGDFTIPPIALQLQVNGGERGNVEGTLFSPATTFSVAIPPALEQADFWVASPRFSVEQSLDRETNALQPGDAFARRIVFRAEDVQAMMLPAFDAEPLPGLASYPAPPQLNNSNNRGRTSASRSQTINYVAEKPGDYLLPARDYFWWDTRSASLEVLTLPAIEVHVAGEITPAAGAGGPRLDRQTGITIGASVLTALLLGWLAAHYRPWIMLAGLRPPLHRLGQRLQALRKPALAEKLNPDNSAGE